MSRKLNHHFVPQYHFRVFSGGKRYIHLASRDGSRFVRFASVKGQCARHKFYGDEKVEDWLGSLESRHAAVCRAVLDLAWGRRSSALSPEEDHALREAILLQRARTPRAARVHGSSMDQMMLYAYREYLKALPPSAGRRATIDAIECGKAVLKNTDFIALMHSLEIATRGVRGISDLSLLSIRNQMDVPFMMGDAPCVFSNHYMKSIRDSGVLGYLTPGLMAVLPIDTRTQVLLYDSRVYRPDYSSEGCIDILRKADVSQLNALQIHASWQNVYYADVKCEDYLETLLSLHRPLLQDHRGGFGVYGEGGILIHGIPNVGEVMHIFEPQLPVTLDLSFLQTAPLPRNVNPNLPRDSSLAREVEEATALGGESAPTSMDSFARWMESQISISETGDAP